MLIKNCLIVLLLATIALGCAAQKPERTENTVQSLKKTKIELSKGKRDLQIAVSSLNELLAAQGGSLPSRYEQYVKDLERVEDQAQKARARVLQFETYASLYVNSWAAEIQQVQNPQIRESSIDRQHQRIEDFKQVITSFRETGLAYRPFVQNLKDIKVALANDLNMQGITTVRPIASRVSQDANLVERQIDRTMAELDVLQNKLSTTN